jgi:hypothetical protein
MAPTAGSVNPLSRREVLKFGAYTSVGGVLMPGISLAQAVATDTKGIDARDVELTVGGTKIPAYEARLEASGRYPVADAIPSWVISGFTGSTSEKASPPRRVLVDALEVAVPGAAADRHPGGGRSRQALRGRAEEDQRERGVRRLPGRPAGVLPGRPSPGLAEGGRRG